MTSNIELMSHNFYL